MAVNSARFQAIAALVTLVALGLLISRSGAGMSGLAHVATLYGTGVLSILACCVGFHFITARLRERKVTPVVGEGSPLWWYRRYLATFPFRDICIGFAALVVSISSFTVYKARVVGADGYAYDTLFTAWDRAIFGGQDPWVLTHALVPSDQALAWIDFLYHPAFLPMVLGFLVCLAVRSNPALRYTYMLSYLICFVIVGMILADRFNAAGPIFDGAVFGDGTTFAPLIDRLQGQAERTDARFWPIRNYLLALHQGNHVGFGGGISGMPSMHVVLAFLWAFAGWHISRTVGWIVTVYAGFIWFSSVHLGWHYFVDGLVGLAVLGVVWATIGRTMGLYGKVLRPAQAIRATT